MAMKAINKRCPFQMECDRKTCAHINSELMCDYYKNNACMGRVIDDQEDLRAMEQKAIEDKILSEELADIADADDTEETYIEAEAAPTEKKLVYIPIDQLYPHPDNPRKDLGDLEELAESIKAKGVMQNLTVVPYKSKSHPDKTFAGYTVIIGHRRRAAAELAGLTELPCVITEMTEQEQIATMLLENMQRSDLTVYEQAQGFQMMFDFGESVESIAEKTGFSKTTVRRRLKMAELDQATLKTVSERQLSLADFDRLGEIKDKTERDRVLATMGTNNFENALKKAIRDQNKREKVAALREVILANGFTELSKEEKPQYSSMVKWMSNPEDTSVFDSMLDEKDTYRFELNDFGTAYFYQKRGETEESRERDRIAAEQRKRQDALNDAAARAYELRKTFIAGLTSTESKAHIRDAIAFIIKRWWTPNLYGQYDQRVFAELLGADIDGKAMSPDLVMSETLTHPEYSLICFAYAMWSDGERVSYHNYYGKHEENLKLNSIYAWLKDLGYEMSDEELSLQDGTSELFLKDEPAPEDDAEEYYEDDEDDEDGVLEDEETEETDVVEQLKEMYGGNDDE